jgi:hypothetical protein
MQLDQPNFSYESSQQLFKTISAGIKAWPQQWKREQCERPPEPGWKMSDKALNEIECLSWGPVPIFPHEVTGRIVICELVNSFPATAVPSPLMMHSIIRFGIRHLLYAILRRHFFYPRGFSVCLNTDCRNFFNIDRFGQDFCCTECSVRHRQRVYWQEKGKKLRKKRTGRRRKRDK